MLQLTPKPEMKMGYSNRKRPMLASVLCIGVLIISGPTLLRALHVIPPLASFPAPTDHLPLRQVLKFVEPVLDLLGAIYLWQMRPFATILFAAEAIIIALSGLYLGFIDPGERMRTLRTVHHTTAIYLFIVAFEFALTIYVWHITTRSRSIPSESVLSN